MLSNKNERVLILKVGVKSGYELMEKPTWPQCSYHYFYRPTLLGGGLEIGLFFAVRFLLGPRLRYVRTIFLVINLFKKPALSPIVVSIVLKSGTVSDKAIRESSSMSNRFRDFVSIATDGKNLD